MHAISHNISSTNDELHDYLSTYFFVNASSEDIDGLLAQYSEDPAEGSPYGTGMNNSVTPQFKRIAAILGDIGFEAPKRAFVQARVNKQDIWVYRKQCIPSFE